MDIIYFGSVDWDFLWQRPQQLITRLAKSHRILFVDPPYSLNRLKGLRDEGIRDLAPNIHRCTPPPTPPLKNMVPSLNRLAYRIVARRVSEYAQHLGFSDPVLWINQPQAGALIGCFQERMVCYDCMDDHESFSGFARKSVIRDMETEVFERADIVLTLSPALHEKASQVCAKDRVFLVRDGGDPSHFTEDGPLSQELREEGRPLIGFAGAIYEWVDIELLMNVATNHPEWTLVLIGPVKAKKDQARLESLPNIRLLGRRPYSELPDLIRCLDVCLLPFIQNQHIDHSDPIILYDYLALGKPVVSTDFPAARSFGGDVLIGLDAEHFSLQIATALSDNTPVLARARRNRILAHSWDQRASQIQKILQKSWKSGGRTRSCHLVVGATVGGVERLTCDLLTQLQKREDVTALCSKGHTARMMRAFGIRTRTVTLNHSFDIHGLIKLVKVLRQERPWLLQTHDRRGNLYGWLASWFVSGVKRVATVHRHLELQTEQPKSRSFRFSIDRVMLRSADAVIAVSRSVADELVQRIGLPSGQISVIHPGIDVAKFRHGPDLTEEARSAVIREWDIPESNQLIGILGRLEIEKGQRAFLEILPEIVERASAVTVLLIGEGSLRSHLEQYIHDRGLDIYVRILGFQEDIPRILRTLDIVIVPSLGEAFGMVVTEAMAMAKPVIAYSVGGIREIITENGVTGILVAPDDREELTQSIVALLNDEDRRKDIGQAARETVERDFTMDRMVDQVHQVYNSLS